MEGTIQQLFEGHHMSYVECVNVDYKSTRKESFYGMGFAFRGRVFVSRQAQWIKFSVSFSFSKYS